MTERYQQTFCIYRYNIEKLKLECRLLESETTSLQQEVKEKMKKPTSNVRMAVFPQLYRERTKCLPDDDVILDIPTRKTDLIA